MGIISSEIIEDSLQAHGQRYIRERHVDHLGREYLFSYTAAKDVDAKQIMTDRIPGIQIYLAEYELGGVLKKIESSIAWYPLEFATNEQLLDLINTKIGEYEKEIADLSTAKTFLEGELK